MTWNVSGGPTVPTGYYVTRTSGGVTAGACASDVGTLLAGASCTDSAVPDGAYSYTVTAVFRSWTATSAPSTSVSVWTATQLAFTSQPGTTVAGATVTPAVAVTVQTATGAAVPLAGRSISVSIAANPGLGTLSGNATASTTTAGVATFDSLSIDRSGLGYTLAASSTGLTSATSAGFTVTPAPADRFAITSAAVSGPAATTATLGPITVAIRDALGNAVDAPAGGSAVTLTSSSTGTARFSATSGGAATTTVTIPTAQSSVSFYYGDTAPGAPTITASGALTSATQVQTIVVGAASKVALTGSIAGVASATAVRGPVTVHVRDVADNPVSTGVVVAMASDSAGTAVFSATPGGAAVSTITIPSGQSSATFYYGDTKATGAGVVTITATAAGLTGATLSGAITPAAPSRLAFGQQPTSTAKGSTITPAVTARILDTFGNLTTSTASVSIAIDNNPPALLGLGGGILSGTTTRSAVGGVATFSNLSINGALGIGGAGTGYTLRIASTGVTAATSTPFNII